MLQYSTEEPGSAQNNFINILQGIQSLLMAWLPNWKKNGFYSNGKFTILSG